MLLTDHQNLYYPGTKIKERYAKISYNCNADLTYHLNIVPSNSTLAQT